MYHFRKIRILWYAKVRKSYEMVRYLKINKSFLKSYIRTILRKYVLYGTHKYAKYIKKYSFFLYIEKSTYLYIRKHKSERK